ncbi:MAG: DUF4876 domain-containing protein [Gemmatimonadaceae bacterium]|jgi:hypothetical protein
MRRIVDGRDRTRDISGRALVAWLRIAGIAGIAGVLGCGTSETRDVVGPASDTTEPGGGNVQRATLTVTSTVGPDAQAQATALGWGSVVGNTTVDIVRVGSSARLSTMSDAAGIAVFTGLLPGSYRISGARVLDAAERAQLESAGHPADALGGALTLTVDGPASSTTLPLSAGSRGSLVWSEATASLMRDPAAGDYFFGQFLEIHNNSDTTIFLGGKTLAKGLPGWFDYPMFPCSLNEAYQHDSLGIWSKYIYRFPGGATSYPLVSGARIVLAVDAIDHSTIVAGGLDLRAADFEFRGSQDVDNPSVPDMISIGPSDGGMVFGHGLVLHENREVLVLAEQLDPSNLPAAQITDQGTHYVRLPADAILDVVTLRREFQSAYPECGPAVHPRFDKQDAELLTRYDPNSAQRRVLLRLPGDSAILQRSGTSSVDFFEATPTPGRIP